MQSLADPTLLSGSDVSFDYVFNISSSIPFEQGGIPLSLSMPPPSPRMVYFYWNDLVDPHFPSSAPFQITVLVESMLKGIRRCFLDEGSTTIILSSSAWEAFGSPKLVSATSELLDFDRKPSECLGLLPQFSITLGGKTVVIDMLVVPRPLEFKIILGHDYVYAMKDVVSTMFHVMHFPHNGSIFMLLINFHLIITILVLFQFRFPFRLFLVFA
jgi:hypothetical protein